MRAVAGDAGKTIHHIAGLFGTQAGQFGRSTQFRHLLTGSHRLLQPIIELGQGNTILHHRPTETFDFGRILDTLQVVGR